MVLLVTPARVYLGSSGGRPSARSRHLIQVPRGSIQVFLRLLSSPAIPSLASYVCWGPWRTPRSPLWVGGA